MLWQRCCGKDVVAKMLWQWCCGKVVVAMAQLLVRSHPRPKIRDFSSGDQYSVSDENSCHPTMCFYLNVILSRAESIIKYWLTVCFHSHLEQLSIEKLCYSTLKFVYDIGGTSSPSLALRPVYKKAIDKKRTEHPVWPDWAIYCTLGNFSKPVATIILPKSPTFLGNFCKVFEIFQVASEVIFGQLLQTFGIFLMVTLWTSPSRVSSSSSSFSPRLFMFHLKKRRQLNWTE